MSDASRIRAGMLVYSADGQKLGRVESRGTSTFTIERGFFFPTEYVAHDEDVASVAGEEVRLTLAKDEVVVAKRGLDRDLPIGQGSSALGPGGGIETSPSTGSELRSGEPARATSPQDDGAAPRR